MAPERMPKGSASASRMAGRVQTTNARLGKDFPLIRLAAKYGAVIPIAMSPKAA